MPFPEHIESKEEKKNELFLEFYKTVGTNLTNRIFIDSPVEYFEAIPGVDVNNISILQVPKAYDAIKLADKYNDKIIHTYTVYSHIPGPCSPAVGLFVTFQIEKETLANMWVQPRTDIKEKQYTMCGIVNIFTTDPGSQFFKFVEENEENITDLCIEEDHGPGFFAR